MLYQIIAIFFLLAAGLMLYLSYQKKEIKKHIYHDEASLNADELMLYAERLSKQHEISDKRGNKKRLIQGLKANYQYISQTYESLMLLTDKGKPTVPAGEWILDNFYIIEKQIKETISNLKTGKIPRLPVLLNTSLKGYPRIYAIILELVTHCDSRIHFNILSRFISIYQNTHALLNRELWAIGLMSEIALVESIKIQCEKINDSQQQIEKAERTYNILKNYHGKILKEDVNATYYHHLYSLIKQNEKDGMNLIAQLDEFLQENGLSADKISNLEYFKQASCQVTIGNAITSLRNISSLSFTELFEQLSEMDKILRQDPAEIYEKMDFPSKNHYRHLIELYAQKHKVNELLVAKRMLKKAQEGRDEKRRHIGYYIYQSSVITQRKKKLQALYFILLYSISILLSGLAGYISVISGNTITVSVLLSLILLIPFGNFSASLCNYSMLKAIPPSKLPALELKDGIPEKSATFVVITTLLPSAKKVEEYLKSLERYYLSNRFNNAYFGILGDFKDSVDKQQTEDSEIQESLCSGIEQLNKKYGTVFFGFLRERQWNEQEQKWESWERKRGALVQFSSFLCGNTNEFRYVYGNAEELPHIQYVVTLDSDTVLSMGSLKQLVGTISHPLNRPEFDGTKVTSGYGLLQPKISIDIESANRSIFSKIFGGAGGSDPYTFAISDIYQDLFDEGIFTGKGIFDVQLFQKILPQKIPDNTVLSHDLLEGSYLRSGLATEINLIDEYPYKFLSYVERQNRWTRGDWQILPWLFNTVRDREHNQIENTLNGISKYKIYDNLKRSLFHPMLLLFILILAFFTKNSNFLFLGSIFLTIFSGLIIKAIDSVITLDIIYDWRKTHITTGHPVFHIFLNALLTFLFLPYTAVQTMASIIRALYRQFVSKKKMLEWTTAADSERKIKGTLASHYAKMFSCVFFGVLLLFCAPIFQITGIFWILSPWVAAIISKPIQDEPVQLSQEQKDYLKENARRIWSFFDDIVSQKDNYLPPDNYQEYPPNGIAHRTSPTNIGLYLLAILSARDFGFINENTAIEKISSTIETIEKLEKWNGHLFNWYNTKTLAILRPRYISTVDSGNFIGYLITLREGLLEFEQDVNSLINRIDHLVNATDFSPLYDSSKNLFSIGYHFDEQVLTQSYYDLLASEARQTSYIAIARGEVPKKHWNKLGRNITSRQGKIGLVSWTGTMFEYLMPELLLTNYKNTLFDATYQFLIDSQIEYGKSRRVPWGTSESGFFAFDINFNYQYKAFGVPNLGLKRGLISDTVVAPYATLLALMVRPQQAISNLHALEREGAYHAYGFFEAIDYTPQRVLKGETRGIVKSYMAHHQGMALCALNNLLHHNILQKRFMHNAQMASAQELLQEKIPSKLILTKEYVEKVRPLEHVEDKSEEYIRTIVHTNPVHPACHFLSNGKYSVFLTDKGTGFSKIDDKMLTRWRNGIQDSYGSFIFIENHSDNTWWTNTLMPGVKYPDSYRTVFSPDKAAYQRTDGYIDTSTEVTVCVEENAEIRRLELKNNSNQDITLDVTSYTEAVIAHQNGDLAHQAFSNLFVTSAYYEEYNALALKRRKRSKQEQEFWMIHYLCLLQGEQVGSIQYETDRMRFIGRNQQITAPQSIQEKKPLSNTIGAVLDPACAIRCKIRIKAQSTASLVIVTGYCEEEAQILPLLARYRDVSSIRRAFELAFTRSRVEQKYLTLTAKEQKIFSELLTHIMFHSPQKHHLEEVIKENKKGQQALWKHGISGDYPIIMLIINTMEEIDNVKIFLHCHEYFRLKNFHFDLLIINNDKSGYYQPMKEKVQDIISLSNSRDVQNVNGGVFTKSIEELQGDLRLLVVASAIVVNASLDIEKQIELPFVDITSSDDFNVTHKEYPKIPLDVPELSFYNEFGGFSEDEYVILLGNHKTTPLPWSNVIANEDFGTIVTESGGGYTFSENSSENRLTVWGNDYVSDIPSEMIYLKDMDTNQVWTPVKSLLTEAYEYVVHHGFGYSKFDSAIYGIPLSLTVFVPQQEHVKLYSLALNNPGTEERKISLYFYVRPVLGKTPYHTGNYLLSDKKEEIPALLMENHFSNDFPGRIAYISCSLPLSSYTADAGELAGTPVPNGMKQKSLSNRFGAGFEQCMAIQSELVLKPGEKLDICFLLGEETSLTKIQSQCEKYSHSENIQKALQTVKNYWKRILSTVHVKTPDIALNYLLNGWLLYQTMSSRLFARSGFYQSGGAFGYRDQLQDIMALLVADPPAAKKQILLHASHQFEEGDVMHWWHTNRSGNGLEDNGIRTRFSDDYLWLPYVTSEYMKKTGDISVLDEKAPYLSDIPLGEGEDERYRVPNRSELSESLYEHCIRSIEHALQFGKHGLPKMGSGDWNDGMNTVGNQGEGESVWLAFFLYQTIKEFLPFIQLKNDKERSIRYQEIMQALSKNIDKNAWDGAWYRRAYFDDGTSLGSVENNECIIDSLAQSWAAITGAVSEERIEIAMQSLDKNLIQYEEGIIKLLTPPFDQGELNPGYIKGYVPGVRENGGQYTHAAAWVVLAYLSQKDGNKAHQLYSMINPVNHARNQFEASRYKAEPYVVAADVYSVYPNIGRGGWTWYTGAAGWLYRIALEFMLGFQKEGETLKFSPCIPQSFDSYEIHYRYQDTMYHLFFTNSDKVSYGITEVYQDGNLLKDNLVELKNDKLPHHIKIIMGN